MPPRMGVLVDERLALVESQGFVELDELDPDVRVFTDYDRCQELLQDGHGEALTWNKAPVKWRRKHPPDEPGWRLRASDVRVVHLPFPADDDALDGLCAWRDWLAGYGASPLSSLGSSAFSLLRARLDEPLWTTVGDPLPFRFTLGGRQELGWTDGRRRTIEGALYHYDLPAAYAATLAGFAYGGHWLKVPTGYPFEQAAELGTLVFVRARVKVPDLRFGPLPRRPRSRDASGWDELFEPVHYPTGVTMQGCWAWPELRVALDHGCELRKVIDVWVHAAPLGARPFWPWWLAVEQGRGMRGFAGGLAKATGNALWGQFCITHGARDVVSWTPDGQRRVAPAPSPGTRPRAFDLAEQITGAVRGRMARFMLEAGDRLVTVHTDGGWTTGPPFRPEGFRLKQRAERLDVLNPQLMRVWEPGQPPAYVVSGVPPRHAPEWFERVWADETFGKRQWIEELGAGGSAWRAA